MRQIAAGAGLVFEPDEPGRLSGHSGQWAHGRLKEPDTANTEISFVVLAHRADSRYRDAVAHALEIGAEVVVIFDQDENDPPPALPDGARGFARPLGGDFSAQRNVGQGLARHEWVFHLDTDERLDRAAAGALPLLLDIARRDGLLGIGFPRRNFVSGELSSLYPDTQYRLLRRDVRFEGRVHERPDCCSDWTRTMIALGPGLRHEMNRARVAGRRLHYDELGQGEERRQEARALLTPFPRQQEARGRSLHTPPPSFRP
jgi:hypothetical protein